MADRVLRLYAGTEKPTSSLTDMAEFITKVYTPMWFNIKLNFSSTSGSFQVFKTIELSRYLRDDSRSIVDTVIKRNAYFIHPENILLCMLTDTREWVRELSLQRILKARENSRETVEVRHFVVPKINFNTTDYFELIYWNECDVTPPPVLRDFTDDTLKNLINETEIPDFDFRSSLAILNPWRDAKN
ncbi:unnamed protein product [Psylliodes chrysocephalus]|uniref:Uncharacterized protein n=1 Tax=Psylliodes chrysocephalus TaxID=3402493 RepID=A0A9P0CHQ4_9CUCU|nr:unnamed protein product [Psylliodes chrysocephala]